MTVRRLLLIVSLAIVSTSGVFAQFCDKIDTRDADMILGGQALPMSVGALGCSYSVREKGVRLTLTLSDEGANARRTFDKLRQTTKSSGWLISDEQGMGIVAYGEMIKKTPSNPTGKCGYVVLKGSRLIQIYVSDSPKFDLAGKRETLDKLRPIARKAIDRL